MTKYRITIVAKQDHLSTENDFYVGRGSIFGNPYSTKTISKAQYHVETVKEAVEKYEKHFNEVLLNDSIIVDLLNDLLESIKKFGYLNLVCYCKTADKPTKLCHAEIIKKYLEKHL